MAAEYIKKIKKTGKSEIAVFRPVLSDEEREARMQRLIAVVQECMK